MEETRGYIFKSNSSLLSLPQITNRVITVLDVEACVKAITLGVVAIAIRDKFTKDENKGYSVELSVMGGEFLPFQLVADNGDMVPLVRSDGTVLAYKKDCDADSNMKGLQELMAIFNEEFYKHTKHTNLVRHERDRFIVVKKLQNNKKALPRTESGALKFDSTPFSFEEFKGEKPGKLLYRVSEVKLDNDEVSLTSQVSWTWEMNRHNKYESKEERRLRLADECVKEPVKKRSRADVVNAANLASGISTQVEND